MVTVFSKIIRREIMAYIIAEDKDHLAFLTKDPEVPGHTLSIPKVEIDNFFDLTDRTLTQLMIFSKKVAIGMKNSLSCLRIAVKVHGLEVPHAHVHLIPLYKEGVSPVLKTSEEFVIAFKKSINL